MISAQALRDWLAYDEHSGTFLWRKKKSSKAMPGYVAGTINSGGYRVIRFNSRTYGAHRLAWLYMTGEWPKGWLDHINLDRADNRWVNLRVGTPSDNAGNRPLLRNNKSGLKGADFHTRHKRWRAQIRRDGRTYHIGMFDTAEEAHEAYRKKAEELFGEFARMR